MPDEDLPTIGTCHSCARTFAYTSAKVMMITVDPRTGLPPGMTVLGTTREPTPEAVARAVDKPVCPDCVDRARRYAETMDAPAPAFPVWPRPNGSAQT